LSSIRGSRRGARRAIAGAALAACCLALPTAVAPAAPGELDPSFGNGGKSIVDLGGAEDVTDLLLQPDGKVIVTGSSNALNPTDSDLFAARLQVPQATLDPSYGGGFGWSRIDFGGNERGGAAVLQPDSRIIVAGTTDAIGDDYSVARLLNPEGTFDSSFGSGGFRTGSLGGSDGASGVALQPDNRIVFAGSHSSGPAGSDWMIGRLLNPQATPDGSFGSAGFFERDFGGSADQAYDVLVQPDGKILVAGDSHNQGVGGGFGAVLRLLPGGTPDNSFGNSAAVDDLASAAVALALQPDGKIIVAAYEAGSTSAAAIYRLLPNGDLDGSFGGDGRTGVTFGSASHTVSDLIVQPDGKVIVVGEASTQDGLLDFGIERLQPNGFPDTTFGDGGSTRVDFGAPVSLESPSGLVRQPDGRIIVAGYSQGNINAIRLQGDPGGSANTKCAGRKATVIGTNGKDKLKGTKKRDVISAGKGKDKVKGLKGNDLICGGKGKDKLLGGPGKDKLLGQAGKDTLKGGPGKDKLVGGPGKDKLVGGPGKDSEKP
jgi:uncharacterized delta-60 repeat protein